ncbi:MAG: TAG lipase/steryl ester hydrolase/phospholipase A2/LPA acyltransferase, partial [Planctomycetota bacterium]
MTRRRYPAPPMPEYQADYDLMNDLQSYEEWKACALAEDHRTGAEEWKERDACDLYDYQVIRLRHDELAEIRHSGNPHRLLYYLNEGLHGNMGGMGAPGLYSHARFGTKHLISSYVEELVGALSDLEHADEQEISFREKVAVFNRARDCFGRSALMLSGAGALGAFHIGVAKALSEHNLVPNVVSGASAGSIIAAILGTHHADSLGSHFSPAFVSEQFAAMRDTGGGRRQRLQLEHIKELIETTIPDMTFIEAFEETGRSINISVAPASLHQRSRLLNASTSPNAFIREAVLASCSIPGMFPPVTLAARDTSGKRRPYVPSRQWVDGSISDDMPARRQLVSMASTTSS